MKKWLVFIGLLLVYRLLAAQTLPLVKPLPDLPFAHLDHNKIIYPGDSLAMERFFRRWIP